MNTKIDLAIQVLEDAVNDTVKELEGKQTTREDRDKLMELSSKLTDLNRILLFQS